MSYFEKWYLKKVVLWKVVPWPYSFTYPKTAYDRDKEHEGEGKEDEEGNDAVIWHAL